MIEYDETWPLSTVLRWRGSVIPRAILYALPAPLAAIMIIYGEDVYPEEMLQFRLNDLGVGHMYTASTAVLMLLISFRTSQALGRFWEGTSLLHQMRGEWFDSVSCLFTFSRGALDEQHDEVTEFRHTLVRLMSLCHGSALEEIKDTSADEFEVLDINGLDQKTLMYLDQCKLCFGFNRVEVLLHMIQVLLTVAHEKGVLNVSPPILSRVYQTLSRGLVNLLNAMKIKHTKFPFPWAQLICWSILVLTIWTPFLVTAVVKTYWQACLLSFLPVFGMISLNMVAIELEMPFGNDLNDLPLDHFQRDMNCGLLMLLHHKADLVAHTSPQCKKSFHDLMGQSIKDFEPQDAEFRQVMLAASFNMPSPRSPRVTFDMGPVNSASSEPSSGPRESSAVAGTGSMRSERSSRKSAAVFDVVSSGSPLSSLSSVVPVLDSSKAVPQEIIAQSSDTLSNASAVSFADDIAGAVSFAPVPGMGGMGVLGSVQSAPPQAGAEPPEPPQADVVPEEKGAPPSPPTSRRTVALLQRRDGGAGAAAGAGAETAATAAPAAPARDAPAEPGPRAHGRSVRLAKDREDREMKSRRRTTVGSLSGSLPLGDNTTPVQHKLAGALAPPRRPNGQGIHGHDWADSELRLDALFQLWAQKADAHLVALRQTTALIAERMVSLPRRGPVLHGGQEATDDFGS